MRMRDSTGTFRTGLAVALLAAGFAVAPVCEAAKKRAAPPQKPAAKTAKATVSLDGVAYSEGHRLLESGQVELALALFCEATSPARTKGWSLSVALLCERSAVAPAVAELRRLRAEPIFILYKLYKGTPCYRLCLGITPDRNAAAALARDLPKGFKEHGPFPFPLKDTCDGEELPPPAPPTGTETPPTVQTSLADAVVNEEHAPPSPHSPGEENPDAAASTRPAAPAPPAPTTDSEPKIAPVGSALLPTPSPASAPPQPEPSPEPKPAAVETAAPPLPSPEPAPPRPEPAPETPPATPPPLPAPAPATPSAADIAAAETWFQQGLVAQGRGQNDEARRCYEQALLLQPDKPETLNNLAILHLMGGRFAEARGLLERVVGARPTYGRAHLNLAGALWGLGEREAAVEEARKAARLADGDTAPHLTLASFLRAMGRNDEAKAEARVVLALEPGNAQAKAILGGGTE